MYLQNGCIRLLVVVVLHYSLNAMAGNNNNTITTLAPKLSRLRPIANFTFAPQTDEMREIAPSEFNSTKLLVHNKLSESKNSVTDKIVPSSEKIGNDLVSNTQDVRTSSAVFYTTLEDIAEGVTARINVTERDLSTVQSDSNRSKLEEAISEERKIKADTKFDEHRLLDHIMEGYNKNSRPVHNASHAVNINIGVTLTQIFDVDEKNQVLATHIWLDQEWHDEKLRWNPADYNGLTTLRTPCGLLWKPDIVLYNSVDEFTGKYMQALAMVSHDGNVFWPPIVRMRSTCEIDITYFPFDDQKCILKLGSWAYDGSQVNVFIRNDGVDLSNYVSNGEWELLKAEVKRNEIYYPCCPEPYPDVTFTFRMRRRTLYYTYNVIIPCIMLSCLTLLVFWLTPENGEKVTMGLTVLLSFSVFMLLIAENMPATSFYVPLIGVYITLVMALTSTSVLLAVFVSNVQAKAEHNTPVPACLKKCTNVLAKIFCVRLRDNAPNDFTKTNNVKLKIFDKKKKGKNNILPEKYYSELRLKCNGSMESECHLVEIEDEFDHNLNDSNLQTSSQSKNAILLDLDRIFNRLEDIVERQEKIIEKRMGRMDWLDLSQVIDRCLFYLYLFSTITATVVVLVIIPLTKPTAGDKVEIPS